VEVLSSRGLCLDCAATDDTDAPTPQIVLPVASDSAPAPATFGSDVSSGAPTASVPVAGQTHEPEPEARPLPQSPPGYEILESLGHGGMGDVYLAREQASERLVALKFLLNPACPDAYDRFLVELRVLAKLDHPNIVRVLSHDFLRAQPYFTMEYLPGGSLSRSRDGARPLSPVEAVRLIRVIAGAVAAAHTAGSIHRDLKPSNILLDAAGAPKVADFGLAKRLDENDGLTATTGALGTPGYMPPEQVSRKNGSIGAWSDVYGLGATLYALLTDRPPFCGPTHVEVINQVLADPPPRPRAVRPEIPLALEAIVLKCLAKETKDRYQTVAELLADLDRYEAGQKPAAPLMTRGRRLKLWAQRNRRGMVMASAVVVLLTGAFALGAAYWPRREPPDGPDPREQIQADYRKNLRAGRTVVLVGDRGTAPGTAWRLGGGTFGKAAPGDGIMFETIDTSLLELLDDPEIESYTIRAQIRQTRSLALADNPKRRQGEGSVGVYFGHADLSSANPPTHAFFAVRFADADPAAPPGGPVADQPVEFERVLRTLDPQGRPNQHSTRFAQCTFTPVVFRPGAWRTIEIDVTPQEIRARWVDDVGKVKRVKGPPLVPAEIFAKLQSDLSAIRPDASFVLPTWSPRMPLGIYARSSALEVRNASVTPLSVP